MSSARLIALVALLAVACERRAATDDATTSIGPDTASIPASSTIAPPALSEEEAAARELAELLAHLAQLVVIPRAWAHPPARDDEKRWPWFERRQVFLWNLELDPTRIPTGTVFDASESTEEGGRVGEYIVFLTDGITWWFDGRADDYTEFRNPAVRHAKVVRVFLAVFDGVKDFAPIEHSTPMPLDAGLSLGFELEDGTRRYL